ncbi:MAG: Spy/CpxP family protein refolding chaperone [Thermodesulfobacteriota bacterium]
MNKKAGIGVMVLLITICFVPAMAGAFAQGNGKSGKGFDGKGQHRSPLGIWRNPQMVEKLQLTDQQVDQLRDLYFAHREKQHASKAELNNLRLQMDKAFTEDNVDKATVLQTAEKMADVKGSMFVEKIDSRLDLQEILTADQIEKLKEYRMNNKRKGMQQGQKQMKGRYRAEGQDCRRLSDDSVE